MSEKTREVPNLPTQPMLIIWLSKVLVFMSTFNNQSMSMCCVGRLGHLSGFPRHYLLTMTYHKKSASFLWKSLVWLCTHGKFMHVFPYLTLCKWPDTMFTIEILSVIRNGPFYKKYMPLNHVPVVSADSMIHYKTPPLQNLSLKLCHVYLPEWRLQQQCFWLLHHWIISGPCGLIIHTEYYGLIRLYWLLSNPY